MLHIGVMTSNSMNRTTHVHRFLHVPPRLNATQRMYRNRPSKAWKDSERFCEGSDHIGEKRAAVSTLIGSGATNASC